MHFVFTRVFITEKGDIVEEEEERKRNSAGGGGIDSCIRREGGREGGRERSALIYVVSERQSSYSTFLMSGIF